MADCSFGTLQIITNLRLFLNTFYKVTFGQIALDCLALGENYLEVGNPAN